MLGLVRGACFSLVSVALFSLQPHFGGCESGHDAPDDPVPLPVGAAVQCTGDDDCRTDVCVDSRCLGGLCFVVSPTIDRDRDGQQAIPCGMDCDDSDPNVNPGRIEACNSRDDNCDGMIDENADPLTTTFNLIQGNSNSVGVPWGDELLVTTTTTGLVAAFVVTPDTRVRGPLELVRLTGGSDFSSVQVTAGAANRYLVSYSTLEGRVVVAQIERTGSMTFDVIEAAHVYLDSIDNPSKLASIAIGDRFALLYETTTMGVRERHVRFLGDAAPVYSAPSDGSELDLATDGTNVVVREGTDVVFVRPAGTIAGRVPLADVASRSALTSADGFVFVLNGVGSRIHRVSAMGESAPITSMVGGMGGDVRLFRTGPFLLVAASGFETEVVILNADTGGFIERFFFSTATGVPPFGLTAVPAFGGGALVAAADPSFGALGALVALAQACGT